MGRDDILEKQNVHVLVWIKLDYAHEVYCFLPTNHTNFRASECKTELVRVMPSAAENVKEIYTNSLLCVRMATCSVARIFTYSM